LPILSLIVFLPLLGVVALLMLPRNADRAVRWTALLAMLVDFALTLLMLGRFDAGAGLHLAERATWIERFGIEYHLAIDGISLWLVVLTGLLGPIAVLASWSGIRERVREFHVLLLLLQIGMQGVFLSLDLFLFYVFWEVSLVPMYFLVGIWGHERRLYAAIKFFIYTMAGSLLMLVAILALVMEHQRQTGEYTFNLVSLYTTSVPRAHEVWYFAAFAVAFAIKVPLWPLHTWLPDAHVEAPTAGSMILAGILLKMGGYGFLRFAIPLFPHGLEVAMPWLLAVSVIGILYGALVAMVQPDMKKLVAYSSVSHLGFVMLGLLSLNRQGVEGAVYQMLNHGLSTGALFLLVGFLYERRHTRAIADFGGLGRSMPLYATVLIVVTLSSIGLPGLNGFVGEFLVLLGAFKASRLHAVLACGGVVLGAVYMLWMVERVLWGPLRHEVNRHIPDLNARELLAFAPILVLIVVMGVYPKPFLDPMHESVRSVIRLVETRVDPGPHTSRGARGARITQSAAEGDVRSLRRVGTRSVSGHVRREHSCSLLAPTRPVWTSMSSRRPREAPENRTCTDTPSSAGQQFAAQSEGELSTPAAGVGAESDVAAGVTAEADIAATSTSRGEVP
jgi:NADH-quinone oxidoreductase subunit M